MRHLTFVLGPTLNVRKHVLSRESHGACFFFHGSFCLVKVNGRLREVRGGTIKFLDPQITAWRLFMSAALTLTSHASLPPMFEAFSRTFRKLRTQ